MSPTHHDEPDGPWVRGVRSGERDRFADDLVGLDRDDPEAQAFARHLDRVEQQRSGYTVEGYLAAVGDFADSANRSSGLPRLVAVALVSLMLLGVVFTVWNALGLVVTTLF
ncbi:hypothetical protein GCM10027047_01180 [Rhodococcus aerolatus]